MDSSGPGLGVPHQTDSVIDGGVPLTSVHSSVGAIAAGRREVSDRCVMLGGVNAVFDAELWIWDARKADSWTFVTLPVDVSEEIRELTAGTRRGFGSVRVRVLVGSTTWSTSIFPDSSSGSYVLPIKQAVRKAESLAPGDTATVSVELIDF